ncbi:tyrosine-type recombinase/integrase [Mycetohabitans endofungorum]|uniref:tyrosine-type recombinase/integrase n=1 Tax=Mycetohabitans endofungorum TaxID=417203 RepID=UPI0030CC6BCF
MAHQEGQSLRATLRWLARLRRLQACLAFLQHANNLFFGESFLHDHSFSEWTLHRHRTNLGEQVRSGGNQIAAFRSSRTDGEDATLTLRIQIVGELSALLNRLAARKRTHNPRSTRLIVDEYGRPLGQAALRFRFDRARDVAGIDKKDFQFRDLRAKAGTDKESATDLRAAQSLLGHGSVAMTEHYVRKRGMQVTPTR